ncbi:hypothetical protein RUND412_008845 [Rhizina undulata]
MAASFSQLFSAVIVFSIIAALGVFWYGVSQKLPQLKADVKEQLYRKNIGLSNDGLILGVKDVSNEDYMDKMQRALVKTLNSSHANPAAKDKHYQVRR